MPMRKLGLILLLATLATILTVGCSDDNDSKPTVTRLTASSLCGVAPMRVDFRADATGGVAFPEPTGGNNWLQMNWDFGDGTTIVDGTSVAYHTFTVPDTHLVTVTAVDESGDQASRTVEIITLADSMGVLVYGMVDDQITDDVLTCRPYHLGTLIETCGFDPVLDSYERFIYHWEIGDATYTSPDPWHTFLGGSEGLQTVRVRLEYPDRSITRNDSLIVNVTPSPATGLSLAMDWLESPQGTASDTLFRDVPSFPDTLTYSIRVSNSGPGDAYNLTVVDTLDNFNRIHFFDAATTTGDWQIEDVEVDGLRSLIFTWDVPLVAAGEVVSADVSFFLEMSLAGRSYEFHAFLPEYTCDAETNAWRETAVLEIVTAP